MKRKTPVSFYVWAAVGVGVFVAFVVVAATIIDKL